MQNEDLIKLTIKSLKTSRDSIAEQLRDIDQAIAFQESLIKEKLPEGRHMIASVQNPNFSVPGKSMKKDIISIFEDVARPLKLGELQEIYAKKYNSEVDIRETVRGMQKKKELALVKVNNSNRNAYWLKASWVYDGEIKEEFSGDLYLLHDKSEINVA